MGDWPLIEGQVYRSYGITVASSDQVAIDSHVSQHTKGSYSELCPSLTNDISMMILEFISITATRDYLIDIAIGAEASEQIIIPNLIVSDGGERIAPHIVQVPISLPAGTRISARCQASIGSSQVKASMHGITCGFNASQTLQQINTYGAVTADSGGTSIDPGGVAHTKGAYVQLAAATVAPIKALLIGIGNQTNNVRTAAPFFIDVAVGAGGSEQVIIENYYVRAAGTTNNIQAPYSPPFPVNIPSGSRLAVRASTSITDATDRLFDVILYGVS